MFGKKRFFGHVFFGMVILLSAVIINNGCETADQDPEVEQAEPEVEQEEPEEKEEVADKNDEEELNDDLVFMLPRNAGNIAVSPQGKYLLFTNGGTQFEPYFMIDTQTYEAEYCDQQNAYWGEVEQLPTPGLEHGRAYSPQFSPDGEKLLYTGYGYEGYVEFGAGSIYLSHLDLPPEIYDQVDLESEEVIEGISPAWKADQEGIYYISAKGVMSYCSREGQIDQIYEAGDLSGLVQDNRLAPYAFYIDDDLARLAYFYEGRIKLLSLENSASELEVFETGLTDINNLEFIFEGKYLVLESAYMFDVEGHWLEFFDMEEKEMIELDHNYLPLPLMYAKTGYQMTGQGKLVLNKVEEKEDSGPDMTPVLLNSKLEKGQNLDLPQALIRVEDIWCVIETSLEGTALYKVDME